ncbi:DUF4129 domain-containing protein [Glycomyces sp. TRM65418]|uniref:DUF4129 domain-containing protein n=1 Tax=Glycomyces sp. TRM65418 TaxID=2867006 RepID=UPI001CE6925F|nr:DUF4129 domain-containing protein [Glycomyces sp. TRM65418]MCC3762852.1 DUF4129 domain-containing protein [Glycomyces sp. TRM65418]QZD56879.1 DUF4129 domain-containing protein [Glycomyces sp. TRM65418]
MAHPGPQPRPTRRWLPVLVVVAALLVVGLAAQGTGLQWQQAELPEVTGGGESIQPGLQPSEEMPSAPEVPAASDGFSFPPWVSWLILAVLVGIPLAFVLLFVARKVMEWLIDAPPNSGDPDLEPQYLHRDFTLVEDAVSAALADMDLGTDPRAAIMACWVHFERASEAVGIERETSDTPSDLVRKLLERHQLDGAALNRLSEAYLRARYSPHQVGQADRDRARDALVALQAQLGVREGR